MMDIRQLHEEYNARKGMFIKLAKAAKFILAQAVPKKRVKMHSLIYRVKSFDSFIDKIRRKNIVDPFGEIYDLVGLRIVCLYLSDLSTLRDIVRRSFNILGEDDKIADTDSEVFGYMSLHIKAAIEDKSGDNDLKDVSNIPFEIQIRTIVQDAWASISHHLDYKQEESIPEHLRRDFHALSGLFYVADTHFAMLKKEQQNYFFNKATGTKLTPDSQKTSGP